MKKVELTRHWRGYAPGTIVQVQPNIASFLIDAGTAKALAKPRRRREVKQQQPEG